MKINTMSPELLQIYHIKNLESVKIWDLVDPSDPNHIVLPTILITYDGGKNLNLCARDPFFDIYVQKIVQVYHDESQNILEDGITDPFQQHNSIQLDSFTKKVLEEGYLEQVSNIYQFYDEKDPYPTTMSFQIDEVRMLVPIVRYHVAKFFSLTDQSILFDEKKLEGYREHYSLSGTVNGLEAAFPLLFEKEDSNKYHFWLSGCIAPGSPISMNVIFTQEGLNVEMSLEGYDVNSFSRYSLADGIVKENHRIEKDGREISYVNQNLKPIEQTEQLQIANLDEDTNLTWFQLPWGGIYGIDTNITSLSETEKVVTTQSMYVNSLPFGFLKKEFYGKQYKQNKNTSKVRKMMLDELEKTVLGFSVDENQTLFVIETTFENSKGFYNGVIPGNIFYHACYSDSGIKGITRDHLVNFGPGQGMIENTDLIDPQKIKLMTRGE